MKKTKAMLPLLALALLAGAFLFPLTAHAQTADTTPPTVSVELSGDVLKVTAMDASGVAAVYINETRFSTLVNGTASVGLKEYAGTGAQVAVSAVDTAGNRSQPVLIDNPYYVAITPQPSPTPSATSTPAPSVTSAPTPTATSTPQPTVTSTPGPVITLPETTQSPNSEDGENPSDGTQSAIPDGTGAFTPDGSGTVMDNATEEEGKEFFTITTAEGSVYYLVIDRQRGTENVYFLSTVTKEGLVGLAESGAASNLTQPEPQTPVPTPTPDPEPVEQPTQDEGGGSLGTILFVLIAAVVVGGIAYYVKIVKPRKEAAQADGYEEYEEDEDEGEDEEYFFDETDKYHPGEPDEEA